MNLENLSSKEIYLLAIKSDNPLDFYKEHIVIYHPDRNTSDSAKEIASKLGEAKNWLETGFSFQDELSTITYNHEMVDIQSIEKTISKNLLWYERIREKATGNFAIFSEYLPEKIIESSKDRIRYKFRKRSIPLNSLPNLPQEHVNWIVGRLLEFCSFLAVNDFVHAGLNIDSIFVTPETHGVQIVTFNHTSYYNKKLTTLPGKYVHWYPSDILTDKMATLEIDSTLSKRVGLYLLGDKGAVGNSLLKNNDSEIIRFLQTLTHEPIRCMQEYRQLIDSKFKKQFINFNY